VLKASARRLRQLGAMCLALLPGAAHAQAIPAPDPTLAETLLQLRMDGGPAEVVSALGRDTLIFVPVRRLLELAEVRITGQLPGHRVAGLLQPEAIRIAFDTDSGTVVRGDSTWRVGPDELLWHADELYLTTDRLGSALDVSFQVDLGELILHLSHTGHLPAVRRLARERRRRVLLGLPASTPWETTLAQRRRVADGAVLDWAYTGSYTDPVNSSLLQLGLGAQVLGGSLDLEYIGQQSRTGGATDVRSSWSGAWPAQRYLRQLRLGDIVPGARRGRTIRGFEVTNAPFLRPAAFGQEVLGGSLPAGWDVDLYADQQLLGFSATDPAGRYAFDLPVRYGVNPVDIVAYGPNGEVLRRRRTMLVPHDRLPERQLEYALSAGGCEGSACTGALSLSARYGVSRWLTAEAGSDNFWRDSLPSLWHPYGLVSAAVTPSTSLTLEAVARGLVRGRTDFDPTPDFHVDLEHTRFTTGVTAPLVGSGTERSRTDAVLFWRPNPAASNTFLQLALSRSSLTAGTRNAERLAVTTRLSHLRLVAGLHHQSSGLSGGDPGDAVGVDAAGDAVLRGPGPILRSLLVRGGFSVEAKTGLSRIVASVGRQIGGPVRLDLQTGWSRAQRGMVIDLSLTTNLPALRAVSRSRYTRGSGVEGTNFLEGSATYDRHLGRFEFGTGRLIGRARVVGRVFRDDNVNGRWDQSESGLGGVVLRVGSRGVTTDSMGRYTAWDLVPFEATTVEVDTLSIKDPLWVPASLLYRVSPGPNAYEVVDIPLLPASEVTGRVVLAPGNQGVGGVPVVLRHLGSGATVRVITFSDGGFYVFGLRPGTYEASVESGSLRALRMTGQPVRFTLDPGPQGGSLDGVVLRLNGAQASSPERAPGAAF